MHILKKLHFKSQFLGSFSISNHTLFVRCNYELVAIFPVTNQQNNTYYPILPVHTITVVKTQEQTIPRYNLVWYTKTANCNCLCHVTCCFLFMHVISIAAHGESFRSKSTTAFPSQSYFFS